MIEQIHQWLSEKQSKVAPKTKLGEAIAYNLKYWPCLTLFLEHPEPGQQRRRKLYLLSSTERKA